MNWEELVGSDQRERDERDASLDGHEGAAGEEGLGLAVGGATAFRKDHEGQAGLEGCDSAAETGARGSAAGLVYGHLTRAVEVPADEGNLPEPLFGEDA